MTDITPIIAAITTLIGAIITTFLIPYIRSKTSAAQREMILFWVQTAVHAAEQLYKGAGRGEEKKEYVLEFLRSKGFYLDDDIIDAMIESAVIKMNAGLGD